MKQTTKIRLIIVALVVVIGVAIWWFSTSDERELSRLQRRYDETTQQVERAQKELDDFTRKYR